jgi:hypothetical protein
VIEATLRRWSAWAPGRESAAAWHSWCAEPAPLAAEGEPEARFLPALLRRRCGPLARIMLQAAFDCCAPGEVASVRTVFASRHGNINQSIELLENLAAREPLSPARFSHSVHNAQGGLFSIAAANREPSSSLAAMEDTFGCGFLEALCHLEREPDRPVLLVMGEVPLAPTFAALLDERPASYALALLLARGGEGTALGFALEAGEAPAAGAEAAPWPDALEFLRWLHAGEPRLRLGSGARRFAFQRLG